MAGSGVGEEKRIAILDLDSIAYVIGWGNKIPDGEGGFLRDERGRLIYEEKTEEQLIDSCNEVMENILVGCGCTHYIAYIKGRNTSKHRYKAKSDYKSNRPKEQPEWWDFVKDYLTGTWGAVLVNDIEVDDAVNITRLKIKDSYIVAVDKDLLNLEGTHYNWKTEEWSSKTKSEATYLFWSDMIAGQPGDGVKGLHGKGDKYVEKLFNKIPVDQLRDTVFNEYMKHYGEYKGVEEFYKNYICLKLLDDYEGFKVPEITEFLPIVNNVDEDISVEEWLEKLEEK